jgi:hypothetical protein
MPAANLHRVMSGCDLVCWSLCGHGGPNKRLPGEAEGRVKLTCYIKGSVEICVLLKPGDANTHQLCYDTCERPIRS